MACASACAIRSTRFTPRSTAASSTPASSKVFGIGLESMTVGSNEFYLAYAATHPGVYDLLDLGHFHPTENVADKLSALLLFFDKVPLPRPVRWDSDHVVLFDTPHQGSGHGRPHPRCLGKGHHRDSHVVLFEKRWAWKSPIPGAWEHHRLLRRLHQPCGRLGHGHARHGEVAALRAAAAGRASEGAAGHLPVHREDDAGRAGEVDALRRRVG